MSITLVAKFMIIFLIDLFNYNAKTMPRPL